MKLKLTFTNLSSQSQFPTTLFIIKTWVNISTISFQINHIDLLLEIHTKQDHTNYYRLIQIKKNDHTN